MLLERRCSRTNSFNVDERPFIKPFLRVERTRTKCKDIKRRYRQVFGLAPSDLSNSAILAEVSLANFNLYQAHVPEDVGPWPETADLLIWVLCNTPSQLQSVATSWCLSRNRRILSWHSDDTAGHKPKSQTRRRKRVPAPYWNWTQSSSHSAYQRNQNSSRSLARFVTICAELSRSSCRCYQLQSESRRPSTVKR